MERSGHQLVVATVPTLKGQDIKDYGYQLGRAWGLGDKARNDGAILLLAPTERKVRIEVGYGLEPVLTDAVSSEILRGFVTPKLKAGDIAGALGAGADEIMTVAGTEVVVPPPDVSHRGHAGWWLLGTIIALAGAAYLLIRRRNAAAARHRRHTEQSRRSAKPTPPLRATRDDAYSAHRVRERPCTVTSRTIASPPAYVAPVPVYAPSYESYSSPSPSPSSDYGSSSGFDSGGGSFGGGGADSSY